jgi:ATP-binding cassette subfamily B multidrug efflux pump
LRVAAVAVTAISHNAQRSTRYPRRAESMNNLLRLRGFLRPYWRQFALAIACLAATTALSLAIPSLIRQVVDVGLAQRDTGFMAVAGLAIVAVGLVRAAFNLGQRYLAEWIANRVIYDLRNALYERIQRLPFGYHDRAQTGQLMSRFIEDIATVQRLISGGLLDLIAVIVLFAGIAAVFFALDAGLALIALLPIVFLAAYTVHFRTRAEPMFVAVQNALGGLSNTLQESLTGVQVVKAFAREPHEIGKFALANRELYTRRVEVNEYWGNTMPFMNFIVSVSVVLVLFFGGRSVVAGQLSLGGLVAFNSYVLMLSAPVQRLGWLVTLVGEASAGSQRLFEVLDVPPAIRDSSGARALATLTGRVEFQRVDFSYAGERPTLQDVSYIDEPNQVIALLGLTGSGKTTVVNLIPRFYDVTGGRVLVDGVDVREVQLKSLRSQIGIVLQETLLFSDTIRENIAYGRPEAAQAEIEAAARAARAHDFIVEMPAGYDTVVGERGVTLSGGQQQRIAIARALLLNPRILILDDSTSSVDVHTEYLIQEALAELMRGRTTFVIAQRLSTVQRADQILVLDAGRIVQCGTHAELLQEGGLYKEIYDLQLKDQEQYRKEMRFLNEQLWNNAVAQGNRQPATGDRGA